MVIFLGQETGAPHCISTQVPTKWVLTSYTGGNPVIGFIKHPGGGGGGGGRVRG